MLFDHCACFVTAHGVRDAQRSEMVVRTFEEAIEHHGKPERVMHDFGAAFWSYTRASPRRSRRRGSSRGSRR
jgi:hypothetical protein